MLRCIDFDRSVQIVITGFGELQKERNSQAGTALDKILFRIWYLCWQRALLPVGSSHLPTSNHRYAQSLGGLSKSSSGLVLLALALSTIDRGRAGERPSIRVDQPVVQTVGAELVHAPSKSSMVPAGMNRVAKEDGSCCSPAAATTVVPLFAASCKQNRAP
jgi:hypothetical protein